MAKPAPFPHSYAVTLAGRAPRRTTAPTGPVFTSITLAVEMSVAAADIERAKRILDTSEKHCIISNALLVAITVQADIRPR